MNKEDFVTALAVMSAAYSKDMSPDQVVAWYSFFESDDINVFRNAIKELCLTSKYFPSIAEIKAAMAEKHLDCISADQAWDSVQYAISRYGYYRPAEAMESLTPETQAAVRSLGGFQHLCAAENNEWLRKDFCKIYDDMKGRDVNKYVTGDLITIADIQAKAKLIQENK